MKSGRGGEYFARKIVAFLFDGSDEKQAIKLRADFGRIRWLLSWESEDDVTWIARISAPGAPRTIIRHGKTRVEAIERAIDTLRQSIELRGKRGQTR
jgi:hypothetical protein